MNDITLNLLRKYRRDLHKIPELGYQLPRTISYIKDVLSRLPGTPSVFMPCESTICCFFDRNKGETLAIRACMDGLPVPEETGYPFASVIPFQMHACGHDGDMAISLCLAQYLATHVGDPTYNVLIIFQPAEETYSGEDRSGAEMICGTSLFQEFGVKRVVAIRLWHEYDSGKIITTDGIMLASSKEINVTFTGRSRHMALVAGGEKSQCALDAAIEFYRKVQEEQRRWVKREELWFLNFGRMDGGNVRNQTGSSARLEGSIRAYTEDIRNECWDKLEALCARVASDYGVDWSFGAPTKNANGYPPVTNSSSYLSDLDSILQGRIDRCDNLWLGISDDFAYFQKMKDMGIKGVLFLLGTGYYDFEAYSSKFMFDEEALRYGLDIYKRICTN